MKKIFYLASIAALAFSSCAKDETTEAQIGTVTGGIEIVAAMESNETRTQLVENGNGGFEIVWNGEDAIYVYENADATENVPMAGLRFGLKGGSDGTATGSFYYNSNGGNVDELSAAQDYLAFYPSAPTSAISWDGIVPYTSNENYYIYGQPNLDDVVMQIPHEQTYLPKSFAPGMVPAISKNFTVNEDGTATVEMQPMVDYLMVEVKATAPIETIKLQMIAYDNNGTAADNADDSYEVLPIAGDANIWSYVYDGNVRRYLQIAANGGYTTYNSITLSTGNLADNVALKDINTYVFTIPAGILGMGYDIKPIISFNGGNDIVSGDYDDYTALKNDPQYHFATNGKLNLDTTTGLPHRYWTNTANKAGTELENGIFWFNSATAPTTYNPEGDFIIDSELKFFQYFAEYDNEEAYNAMTATEKKYSAYQKNAYVMEDLELDLTRKNMDALLNAAIDNGSIIHDSVLAKALMKYVLPSSGKFPTITEYAHKFEGNGLSIVDIDQPLAARTGLFGDVTANAMIRNINISDMVAATYNEGADEDYNFNGKKGEKGLLGYILAASIAENEESLIDNVVVANVKGDAFIREGYLANFQEITIGEGGVSKDLEHMIAKITVDDEFEIKAAAWDAMEDLGSVFHVIVPAEDAVISYNGDADNHVLAVLPDGAKYEDFTVTVDNETATGTLSVLAGNLSYWTGGVIEPLKNGKAWNSNKNLGTGGAYNGYAAIQYAEELAGMADWDNGNAYLTRSLDLNGGNGVEWNTVTVEDGNLAGNNKVVSNLTMPVNSVENYDADNVAPFKGIVNASNVKFDGVEIVIAKDGVNNFETPAYISGLFDNAILSIYNVTLEDLNVNLKAAAQNNNPNSNRYVGWFAAWAEAGLTVVNSNVINPKSNVVALHAMIAELAIETVNSNVELEAIFRNSNVSGIKNTLTKIEKFDADEKEYNFVASHVANVYVDDSFTLYFSKYTGSKPVFLYQFASDDEDVLKTQNITVSYENNDEVVINGKNGIVED